MNKIVLIGLCVVLLVLPSHIVLGRTKVAVEIKGDKLLATQQTMTINGHVQLTIRDQNKVLGIIQSNQLTAEYDFIKKSLHRATSEGKIFGTVLQYKVKCDKAEYFQSSNLIHLSGRVEVNGEFHSVHGSELIINISTGELSVAGSGKEQATLQITQH